MTESGSSHYIANRPHYSLSWLLERLRRRTGLSFGKFEVKKRRLLFSAENRRGLGEVRVYFYPNKGIKIRSEYYLGTPDLKSARGLLKKEKAYWREELETAGAGRRLKARVSGDAYKYSVDELRKYREGESKGPYRPMQNEAYIEIGYDLPSKSVLFLPDGYALYDRVKNSLEKR